MCVGRYAIAVSISSCRTARDLEGRLEGESWEKKVRVIFGCIGFVAIIKMVR